MSDGFPSSPTWLSIPASFLSISFYSFWGHSLLLLSCFLMLSQKPPFSLFPNLTFWFSCPWNHRPFSSLPSSTRKYSKHNTYSTSFILLHRHTLSHRSLKKQ